MLTIAIQAGGQSRRMGQDKALLPFLGQPLIQRIVTRLAPLADELIITTNQPDQFRFLGLPLFPDPRPSHGALGGLYTALHSAAHPLVAVVACDMPFASPKLIRFQTRLLEDETLDLAIPLLPAGYEPLHAIYRRQSCLPAVESALDDNQWKLISWFSKIRLRAISPQECLPFDPLGLAFININTPQELSQAEQDALRIDPP